MDHEYSERGIELIEQYTRWFANVAELPNEELLAMIGHVEETMKMLVQDIIVNR